jgi:hypothetical protein
MKKFFVILLKITLPFFSNFIISSDIHEKEKIYHLIQKDMESFGDKLLKPKIQLPKKIEYLIHKVINNRLLSNFNRLKNNDNQFEIDRSAFQNKLILIKEIHESELEKKNEENLINCFLQKYYSLNNPIPLENFKEYLEDEKLKFIIRIITSLKMASFQDNKDVKKVADSILNIPNYQCKLYTYMSYYNMDQENRIPHPMYNNQIKIKIFIRTAIFMELAKIKKLIEEDKNYMESAQIFMKKSKKKSHPIESSESIATIFLVIENFKDIIFLYYLCSYIYLFLKFFW